MLSFSTRSDGDYPRTVSTRITKRVALGNGGVVSTRQEQHTRRALNRVNVNRA